MSTYNICFHREIRKNIRAQLLKHHWRNEFVSCQNVKCSSKYNI